MEPYADMLWEELEVGQLITCEKDGVISGTNATITGFGSAVTSLVGLSTVEYTADLGIGVTVVPTILINNATVGFATGPESDGEWVTQTIPKGKEIIGFYCNTEGKYINRLGFILWTPPHNTQ